MDNTKEKMGAGDNKDGRSSLLIMGVPRDLNKLQNIKMQVQSNAVDQM